MGRAIKLGRRPPQAAPEIAASALEPLPDGGSDAAEAENVVAAIRKVAATVQPDEPGYGQTAYDAEARLVLWVAWDGTSVDEHAAAEAAFLAIDGVDQFGSAAEGLPSGWWEAEVVYPEDPPRWVVDRDLAAADAAVEEIRLEQAALDAVVASARTPLGAPFDPVAEAALATIERSYAQAAASVAEVVASAGRGRGAASGDAHLTAALEALRQAVVRPAPPPAPIHVTASPVTVEAPQVHVTVPEQPAPVANVTVEAAAPQPIHVHVPPQPAPVAPVVNVRVPDPAPINVEVHPAAALAAAAPPPRQPSRVRIDWDEAGRKVFVPEYDTTRPAEGEEGADNT